MGPKNQAVRNEVEHAVGQLDLGKKDRAAAWTQAIEDAKKAANK